MNTVFDFIKAAVPWVATGIALAVFFGRSAAKKKKRGNQDEKPGGDYSAEGMAIGSCIAKKKE